MNKKNSDQLSDGGVAEASDYMNLTHLESADTTTSEPPGEEIVQTVSVNKTKEE